MLEILGIDGAPRFVASGGVATGFLEDQPCQLSICGPGESLVIDDVPIGRTADGKGFSWKPGFYAGRVLAEVVDGDGRTLEVFQLDVDPAPGKLGLTRFQRMLDELMAFRPELLLGTEPAQSPFDHGGAQSNPEIQYARLRRYGSACVKALQIVCSTPLTRLRRDRRVVMPHQARRIDTATVRELSRRPTVSAILMHEHSGGDGSNRISVPIVEQTVDNAANRTIAAVVDRLMSQITGLMVGLDSIDTQSSNPIAPKVRRRRQVLRTLRDSLRRVRRSPTLRAVTRAEITAAGLNVISAQPLYARAYQLAWKALRSGVHGDDASDLLPISPTWEVYERWCFLQVTRALERLHPGIRWKLKCGSSVDSLHVSGMVGDIAITARMQTTFFAWDVASGTAFRSLSAERVPDIVVTSESPSGRKFIVFDAKYRASRSNILDAMQSAHIYRDALLWGGIRPWMSLLLIPRQGEATWLGELDFQERFEVGAVEAAESNEIKSVEHVLERFLASDR